MHVWVIARLTFREAWRKRVLWALLALGILFLILYALGLAAVNGELQDFRGDRFRQLVPIAQNFFLMAGLYAANFLVVMITVLISISTLAGEIGDGTIQSIAVKPLRRSRIVIGKWLGFAGICAAYTLLTVGGVMLIGQLMLGYNLPNALIGLGMIYLESLLLLSITFLGGVRFSPLANGAVAFGMHGLAFIGGWVGQAGALLSNNAAYNVGRVSQIIMPTEALWRRAAAEMQPVQAGGLFGAPSGVATALSPFSAGGAPGPEVVTYTLAFGVIAMSLALWLFSRRDL